jgi:hypothetical protein
VRTVDVRVLVRAARHPTNDILEQLLNGTLRVHAVVELIPDPRLALRDGTRNPSYGRTVAAPPVYRHHRSSWQPTVRDWTGDVVVHDPVRQQAERRTLAARFATQEATRAGAVDELVNVMEHDERINQVRQLCQATAAAVAAPEEARALAAAVLASLDGAR